MLLLIDVSLYDRTLDWNKYTWEGAFVKASEGYVVDPNFSSQWRAAQGRTLRSAYHFFRPYLDPIKAAQKFIGYLGADKGELPPVLDLEATDGLLKGVPEKALAWLSEVEKLTGTVPIVYTSLGFASLIKLQRYPAFSRYKLWIAQYPRDKIYPNWTEVQRREWIQSILEARALPYPWPQPPAPFKKVTFAQFTGKCPPEYVPGYPLGHKLAVDVNAYNGDLKALFDEFNIKFIPTKGDDTVDPVITMEADLKEFAPSNLRPAPGLQAGLIRTMMGPLHIKCIGQKILRDGYYWSEVVEIGGDPEHGWIAWTTSYMNIVYVQQGGIDPYPL